MLSTETPKASPGDMTVGFRGMMFLAIAAFCLGAGLYQAQALFDQLCCTPARFLNASLHDQIFGTLSVGLVLSAFGLLALGLDRRPVIIVSPRGYYDRRLCRQFVPWSLVQEVQLIQRPGGSQQSYIGLVVADPQPYMRQGPLMGIAGLSKLIGVPTIHSTMAILDTPPTEVIRAIQQVYRGPVVEKMQ